MNRRDALARVSWILGGTIVGSTVFLEACKPGPENSNSENFFDAEIIALLNEMGETILPETKTPGAKAAKVGEFMEVMVRDCYTKNDQGIFKSGLKRLQKKCKDETGKEFMACTPAERTAFFVKMDNLQKGYMDGKRDDQPSHYFRMIKELTLLGFFTSEVGSTKAQRYIETPGSYDGNVPYKKGDKAWADA